MAEPLPWHSLPGYPTYQALPVGYSNPSSGTDTARNIIAPYVCQEGNGMGMLYGIIIRRYEGGRLLPYATSRKIRQLLRNQKRYGKQVDAGLDAEGSAPESSQRAAGCRKGKRTGIAKQAHFAPPRGPQIEFSSGAKGQPQPSKPRPKFRAHQQSEEHSAE